MRAVPIGALSAKKVVAVLPLLQGEERFVGIESLDLQVPVVLLVVGRKELEASGEGLRLGREPFLLHVLAVHQVLPRDASQMFGNLGIGDLALPRVALLAAHVLPTRIAVVVGGAPVFPVVVVVRD